MYFGKKLLAFRSNAPCLTGLLFDPEDGDGIFVQDVDNLLQDYMESYPRR
jgi:hypothetical protein